MSTTASLDTLDGFLREQLDVLITIRDNMELLRRIALQYTNVAEFEDFVDQINALYAVLGTISDASELILGASEAGIAILTADDVPAQRALLGLGSAALLDAGDVADATLFAQLQDQVATMAANLTALLEAAATHATQAGLNALATRVSTLENSHVLQDMINQLILDLELGTFNGNLGERITALEAQVADLTDGAGGLGAQIGVINGLLVSLQSIVTANGNAQSNLAFRISQVESDQEAALNLQIEINTRLSAAEGALTGQSSVLSDLSSRTAAVEGGLVSEAAARMALQSQLNDTTSQTQANASATQNLQTQVGILNGVATSASSAITDLTSRVNNAELGLDAAAEARDELATRVTQTEDGIEAQATDITQLEASLTSVGNLLPNAAFEADLRGWVIFSRGAGWLTNELVRNMSPALLPPGVATMGLEDAGLPGGDIGVRTSDIFPIAGRQRYIVSSYLAAIGAKSRLFWRLFDADGFEIDFGLVGETTAPPATNLDSCVRVHRIIDAPIEAAGIQLQWWVTDASAAPARGWLFRPMLEQATPRQINPSPWAPSSTGFETALATAVEEMDARVTSTEDLLEAQSSHLVSLQTQITQVPSIYVQPNEPTGGSYRVGDIWFDTDAGFRIRRVVGGVWVNAQNDPLANALLTLQNTNSAADTLQQDANTAALLANAHLTRLAQVSADNILKSFEKADVVGAYNDLQEQLPDLVALGTSLGLTDEVADLQAAFDELEDYLATLTTPVAWNNTTGDTQLTTI